MQSRFSDTHWLSNLILNTADRLHFVSPIYVRINCEETDASVEFLPSKRLWNLPVGITFASNVMLADYDELAFVTAHELAHVVRGDLIWVCVTQSRIMEILARILVLKHEIFDSPGYLKTQEFEADRLASQSFSKEAFGRFLIVSGATEVALLHMTEACESDSRGWKAAQKEFQAASYLGAPKRKILERVLATFRENRNLFEECAHIYRKCDTVKEGFNHPLDEERMANLGLDWDTLLPTCDLSTKRLIDLEDLIHSPEFVCVNSGSERKA